MKKQEWCKDCGESGLELNDNGICKDCFIYNVEDDLDDYIMDCTICNLEINGRVFMKDSPPICYECLLDILWEETT